MRLFSSLRSTGWIVAKGFLFLAVGVLAAGLLIAEHPTPKVTALVIVAIWGFTRFYYFAFYVIERYVDPGYHFDGLWSFVRYWVAPRLRRPSRLPELPGDGAPEGE